MKIHIAAAAVVFTLAVSHTASAQVSQVVITTAPVITPDTKVYTREQVPPGKTDFYPLRAAEDEVSGETVLVCHVADDMRPDKCVVSSEKPAGYGFGEAAALGVLKYGKADPATQKAGDWLKLTFKFSLGG